MPRPIWRGTLTFGLVSIPVGIHPAESRRDIAFHLLDRRDLQPIHNVRVNSTTGQPVEWSDVIKGYEYAPGVWATVEENDLKAASPTKTGTIDVLGAIPLADVDPRHFDHPYYLAPDAPGMKPYALLRDALAEKHLAAVGQVVLRTRQSLALIIPHGDLLVLETLRYPYELRDPADLELPGDDVEASITPAERRLAEQLVDAIATDWDPTRYHDTYHDDVLALIARGVEGGEVTAVEEPAGEPAPVIDIVELLKKSVEDARRDRAARG